MARIRALTVCLLALGSLAAFASTASAACGDFWTGKAGDGDWSSASNWSSGVPVAATNACIDDAHGQEGTYTVKIDTYNPGLVANSLTIGGEGGSTITLAILGTGGGVQVGNTLTLTDQDAGGGVLAGGAITLGSDTPETPQPGQVVVTAGTLVNQGTVTSEPTFNTGASNGIVGSFDNQGTLNVGERLVGTLGTWTNSGTISIPAGQKLTLNDPSESATAGFTDAGGTIANSGLFEENSGFFKAVAGNLTGNAPIFSRTTMELAGSGSGTFHVEGGATIAGDIGAGYTLWGSGVPGLTHGTLAVKASLTNHGTVELGSLDGTHGTLMIEGGTFTNAGALVFANTANGPDGLDGPLVNDGSVTALTNSVEGNGAITNNASFSIGPNVTFGAASFTQSAGGKLALSIAGGGTPTYPKLQLSGAATLGGSLGVATSGLATGTFQVITASPSSGSFASASFSGENYSVAYAAGGVSLTGPAAAGGGGAMTAAQPKVSSVLGGAGLLKVTVSCPSGGPTCASAAVKATVIERLNKHGKLIGLAAATKAKAKTRRVVVAQGSISLAAGAKKTLTLKLNKAGRALLARFGSLTATVVVTSGGKVIKTIKVHIHKPKKKTKAKKAARSA